MSKEPWDKLADNPSLANILHKSLFIHSNTIIQQDGKVQSFCGLNSANIGATSAALEANTRAPIKQNIIALTSRQPSHHSEFRMPGRAPYTFRINGQNYHRIGSLLPKEGIQPSTPAQIDDIISVEIPSQAEDPKGYKVFTEFMLHGPCGKVAKSAPCNIEGKCSKHFPKAFNKETIIDADGYPIYRRRDNKSFATKGKFNSLIREALAFDMNKSKTEQQQLHALLNPEQRLIFEHAMVPCRPKKQEEDEATWIEIPERFLIKAWTNPIEQIVQETYPDFTTRQNDDVYLKEHAILTLGNDDADTIDAYMLKKLAGDTITYNNADEIYKASTDILEQHSLYPVEFLNSLNSPGMPSHSLCLKKELPIMLMRNINPSKGLCNETRLVITELG
nr:ATP-dependent DNA helicase PIF1-like [Tanacetum cinerariifolium]